MRLADTMMSMMTKTATKNLKCRSSTNMFDVNQNVL